MIGYLLKNAIRHTPIGGSVTVKAFLSNGAVVVEVEDTGMSLSDEEQSRLVDPAFTFVTTAGIAGMDLWICRQLLALHSESISIRSNTSVGKTVFFTLTPYVNAQQSLSAVTHNDSHHSLLHEDLSLSAAEDDKTSLRVLIVDDSELNRKMMRKRFEREGHVCFDAEDGDVAVAMVEAALKTPDALKFDVITMDNVRTTAYILCPISRSADDAQDAGHRGDDEHSPAELRRVRGGRHRKHASRGRGRLRRSRRRHRPPQTLRHHDIQPTARGVQEDKATAQLSGA